MARGNGHDEEDEAPAAEESGAEEPRGLAPVDDGPATSIEELRKERDELRDQLLRRRAEFENYRKRTERDRALSAEDAKASVFKLLVPTLDDLDRALASPTLEGLREGVELLRRNLHQTLETQGVKAVDPAGERFDPERHQALLHEPTPGTPEDTVVQTFAKGYEYKDRLLRPAMVKVSKGEPDGGGEPGAIH
jgi:molecular chaperone GrpE